MQMSFQSLESKSPSQVTQPLANSTKQLPAWKPKPTTVLKANVKPMLISTFMIGKLVINLLRSLIRRIESLRNLSSRLIPAKHHSKMLHPNFRTKTDKSTSSKLKPSN